MRVLVGPRLDLERDGVAAAAVKALAGPGGMVLELRRIGVKNFSRPLSAAEVALLRESMVDSGAAAGDGAAPGNGAPPREDAVVGYVCVGTPMEIRGPESGVHAVRAGGAMTSAGAQPAGLVAVSDHANLTWRSPLAGPNDDSVGPRFPSMTGIYAPQTVIDRLGAGEGMIVVPGVVTGVHDDGHLNAFEAEVGHGQGHAAASHELVPVIIVAAHMGLRVAAVVVIVGSSEKGDR
jgi:hypothetical protein